MTALHHTRRRAGPLETVFVEVPEAALEAYEAAFTSVCDTVGFFLADEDARIWRVEGVREAGADDAALRRALLLAGFASGFEAAPERVATEAEGWLARTQASFPPQRVGRRFLVRGTHDAGPEPAGMVVLTLDAGLAFGSRGAWVDARLPAGAGVRGAALPGAGAGCGHRVGHPGDGGREGVAPPGAGDGYRAVVGAGGPAECGGERGLAAG